MSEYDHSQYDAQAAASRAEEYDFYHENQRVSGVAGVVFGLAALAIAGVIIYVVGRVTGVL